MSSPFATGFLEEEEGELSHLDPVSVNHADPHSINRSVEEVELSSSAGGSVDGGDREQDIGDEEDENWRRNWFVRTFLAEVPIVGHYFRIPEFRIPTCSNALYFASKSVFELVGSGVAIVLAPVGLEESMQIRMGKLLAATVVGKAGGGMAFNMVGGGITTTSRGITTLYQCCLRQAAVRREQQANNGLGTTSFNKISLH